MKRDPTFDNSTGNESVSPRAKWGVQRGLASPESSQIALLWMGVVGVVPTYCRVMLFQFGCSRERSLQPE